MQNKVKIVPAFQVEGVKWFTSDMVDAWMMVGATCTRISKGSVIG